MIDSSSRQAVSATKTPTLVLGVVSMVPHAGVSMHVAANAALALRYDVDVGRIGLLIR